MDQNLATTADSRNKTRIRWIAKTGILTAIASVLMFLEMPLPLMPWFLEFDFSETIVLLGTFSMGPLAGILIELLKNLIHIPFGGTGGVGELANFLVGAAFVGTAGLIYKQMKNRRGAALGMAVGTLAMVAVACLANYFITLPFYFKAFHYSLDKAVEDSLSAGNNWVTDMKTLLLYVFVPFNLFKGVVVSLITTLIYKRVSPLLHR
ncbi:MAG TPA: ECF transporter S component [Clostridiales bacterium]|nr:ECF transporter S component [Clostridiales bacterium]